MPKCPRRKLFKPKKRVKRKLDDEMQPVIAPRTYSLHEKVTSSPRKLGGKGYRREASESKPVLSSVSSSEGASDEKDVVSPVHKYCLSGTSFSYDQSTVVKAEYAMLSTSGNYEDVSPSPTYVNQNVSDGITSYIIESTTPTTGQGVCASSCSPAQRGISEDNVVLSGVSETIRVGYSYSETPTNVQGTCTPASDDIIGSCDSGVSDSREEIVCFLPAVPAIPVDENVLYEAKCMLDMFLHKSWISFIDDGGIQVCLMSRKKEKAIQRRLFFHPDGNVEMSVHCVPTPLENLLNGAEIPAKVTLSSDTMNNFVDRCIAIVQILRRYEICSGQSDTEDKHLWPSIPSSVIDANPYQECRYSETLRSDKCSLLVPIRKWLCNECVKLGTVIRRRAKTHSNDNPNIFTPNIYLSEEQKLNKLASQQKQLRLYARKVGRLEEKIQNLIAAEGMRLPDDMTENLMDILGDQDLTPVQALFLQQQRKAAREKGPSGVGWHPSMIRFALALYMASPSASTARGSGMIKLPSQRTLFDYSRAYEAKEGIDEAALQSVSDHVAEMPHEYQKYHALLCEELHICQNLVFKKSTGEMLGYVNLGNAFSEVAALERFLKSGDATPKPELASKMLTFMVKGTANDVEEVVANFAVNRLTAEFLYEVTWQVINRCERSGIAIVVFVSDGYTVNHSFMKNHKAVGTTESGLIYSTVNKAAPQRLLYFMSDVAHLLKTIRNCLHNSRLGKNSKRCMEKNGEKLLWQTIIDLYTAHKSDNIRKSYELNAQNVYINSYSGMEVIYAAQVLSKTVAKDIEDQKWPGTKELVKFLRMVSDWFDCLNGALSTHGVETKQNLDPYRSQGDKRFDVLMKFLQYLSDWKVEVYSSVEAYAQDRTASFAMEPEEVCQAEDDGGEGEGNVSTPDEKKLLSSQTMDGIEFTTMAFIDLVRFLLREGTKYVNPRTFSQDHIEQHFSKQRHRNPNPNYRAYLQNNVNIRTQGQVGVRKRKANTEDLSGGMTITSGPLPKRRKISKHTVEL